MPRYDAVSLNGCGMVNREISGSGRINASIFVDGRSMMKDRSKSNTGSKLVLEIKWVACLVTSEGFWDQFAAEWSQLVENLLC